MSHNDPKTEADSRGLVGYFILKAEDDGRSTVDLVRAFREVLRSWRSLAVAVVIGALLSVGVALYLPEKYRAQVLVAPVKAQGADALGGMRSQVGGLAALAGISIGSGGRTEEAFATLSSRALAREFIERNSLLPLLFIDHWDEKSKTWRADAEVPSIERGVDFFINNVRSVSEDKLTRLITVRVEWSSAEIAARWANGLVELANESLRTQAQREAEESIKYLGKELQRTTIVELQKAIYTLMEAQINQSMLANVQRQYAFRILDPAVTPERRSAPNRRAIVLLGTFAAAFATFIFLFAQRSLTPEGAGGRG